MRTAMMFLVVVGLLAAPSLGVINIKLTADNVYPIPGETTTIRIWAQGTSGGIFSLAGDIVSSWPAELTSNPGSMAFSSLYSPTGLFTPKPGTAGVYGGWTGFGTEQTSWGTPDAGLGNADYVEICHYTVTAGVEGFPTLTFVPRTISGYKPLETDKTGIIGTNLSVTLVLDVPEPMTLALLAVAGLVVARRRRA